MRMPSAASRELMDVLRPRLSRQGVPVEEQTAITFRYLGGGSYINVCAAMGVQPATVYRALWEEIDAIHGTPL